MGISSIGVHCTREATQGIMDTSDKVCTRKVMRRAAHKAVRDGSGLASTTDIAEAYSPPRMTAMAKKLGYRGGLAMDITTVDNEGRPWDLSKPEVQHRAMEQLSATRPEVLVVSPPCTWFSSLQAWNITKMDEQKVRAGLTEAMEHLAFAVLLCIKQARAGRKFVLEHPATASSWQTVLIHKLFRERCVGRVLFDFCMLGMMSEDKDGRAPAMKRTANMTNSTALLRGLAEFKCVGGHRHVQLVSGRAAACQTYPDEFCEFVCRTVTKEVRDNMVKQEVDGTHATAMIHQLMKADPRVQDELYENLAFFDGVTCTGTQ